METRTCEITSQSFAITAEEAAAYEYFDIPVPAVCPEERYRRQLAFRNEEQFFWRKCDKTGAKLYSIFPSMTAFPVVSAEYWWGGELDALSYGKPFDFKRLFVEQLLDIWWSVPRPAVRVQQVNQCTAVHDVARAKNSYFVFSGTDIDQCCYSVGVWNSKEVIDCYFVSDSERCYECVHCFGCRNLRWSEFCRNCTDSWFLSNCEDCRYCLFCTNLKGKEYYIFNRKVSPEEFDRIVREWTFTARARVEAATEEFETFLADQPFPHMIGDEPEENSGNYLYQCRSAFDSFECVDAANVVHCHWLRGARDCLDGFGFGDGLSRSIQFVNVGSGAEGVINCIECWNNVRDLVYCSYCEESSDLFACVGLRGKQYCIFNTQYSKDEYFELRARIVAHLRERSIWGKFFPANFSGFAYNLSSANFYMPLSKVPAKMLGFRWDDGDEALKPSLLMGGVEDSGGDRFAEVPQRTEALSAQHVSELYLCELSGKPYRLAAQEIALYQALGVAPPGRCFEQRHQARIKRLSPRRLRSDKSPNSGRSFRTAFPEQWRRPVAFHRDWERSVRPLR
ncbi:MAG: hypothetical protein KDD69_09465 [Bdellovibrionales bacterium]|nr:hypothetical protein [Bdellovibrionales bacterium]